VRSAPLPSGPSPSLREAAAAAGRDVGTVLDVWPPVHDVRLEGLLAAQFSLLGVTDLYWTTVHVAADDYFFVPADVAVNFARVHGLDTTGMFLVWDFELPSWLQRLDERELAAELREHVATVVGRYRGDVDRWLVVNEAVAGPGEGDADIAALAPSMWRDGLGAEFVADAFEAADAADPGATLLYNETGAEELGPKSDFLFQLLRDLVQRGVPVDGVGFQFHLDTSRPPDWPSVVANLERFAELGLEIHITELDVALGASTPAHRALQGEMYARVAEVCASLPACRTVTVFGVSDRHAWDELGDTEPLLFDHGYRPKPAFGAFATALASPPAPDTAP
jgi:endo-1,4-beta-xylanase